MLRCPSCEADVGDDDVVCWHCSISLKGRRKKNQPRRKARKPRLSPQMILKQHKKKIESARGVIFIIAFINLCRAGYVGLISYGQMFNGEEFAILHISLLAVPGLIFLGLFFLVKVKPFIAILIASILFAISLVQEALVMSLFVLFDPIGLLITILFTTALVRGMKSGFVYNKLVEESNE